MSSVLKSSNLLFAICNEALDDVFIHYAGDVLSGAIHTRSSADFMALVIAGCRGAIYRALHVRHGKTKQGAMNCAPTSRTVI